MAEAISPAPLDAKAIADAVSTALAAALPAAIAAANGPLIEQLAKLQAPPAAEPAKGGKADADKPLTMNELQKLLDDRDRKSSESATQRQQRDAFVSDKLKDVPEAYRAKLGSDPAKWAAEEQSIRETLKGDLLKLGVKPADVAGGNPASGSAPKGELNYDKLSEGQKRDAAVKALPAVTRTAQAVGTSAAATT